MAYGLGIGGYSPYSGLRPSTGPLAADATGLGGAGSAGLLGGLGGAGSTGLGGAGSAGLLGGLGGSPLSSPRSLPGLGTADPMMQFLAAFAQLVQACMSLASGGPTISPFGGALDGAPAGAPGATGATGNTGNDAGAPPPPAAAAGGGGGGGGGY